MTERKFNALTKPEKRIAIARDVLAQIAAEKIEVEGGSYFQLDLPVTCKFTEDTDLQSLLPKARECTVCAKGALFFAHVGIADKVTVGYQRYRSSVCLDEVDVCSPLLAYFTQSQLDAIEGCFEGGMNGEGDEWNYLFPDATTRLRAICENIITHEGKFKPRVLPKVTITFTYGR